MQNRFSVRANHLSPIWPQDGNRRWVVSCEQQLAYNKEHESPGEKLCNPWSTHSELTMILSARKCDDNR
jgi:hypothetical protein